jgi:hypothetical protein
VGYDTAYKLEVTLTEAPGEDLEAIRAARLDEEDHGKGLGCCRTVGDLLKHAWDETWYEHEDQLREVSLKFPNTLFTLRGHGEEIGDAWVKYFRAGKMQEARATFAEFDPEALA